MLAGQSLRRVERYLWRLRQGSDDGGLEGYEVLGELYQGRSKTVPQCASHRSETNRGRSVR